jgi:hypothetical protein
LSLPALFAAQSKASPTAGTSFAKAKNVIYLYLSGGPSQYETFDPKPEAPVDVRGIFKPIATKVLGVQFCELLPQLAGMADKLAVVRSLATDDNNHESGGYWINTGHKYTGPNMRDLSPTDWPTVGSIVKMLRPSTTVPFSTVMLPEPIVANPNVFLPGQNAGFLGRRWDPELFKCDPAAASFKIEGLSLPDDLPPLRLSNRSDLLSQLNDHARLVQQPGVIEHYGRRTQEAMSVLLSGAVRNAFAMDAEPAKIRDRYGRGKWAQSVLLARRLIEAGVRMVFVNWPREPGDLSSSNPLWDTHGQNNPRMKDVLCPQLDQGFSALIEDLDQRGLLQETLVVAVGEMGRTPKFNGSGGRDHWGQVFSFALAGAGIKAGHVHGASDKTGAYPASDRVEPGDVAATIYHLLGIDPEGTFPDRFGRPHRLVEGQPIASLLA